jgi:Protein of unknown function (DUF 659)
LTAEKKQQVDEALARCFYRTGIPFRFVDSSVFHDFVMLLNPEYENSMPSAKSVAGSLLTREFNKALSKLKNTLDDSDQLELISDGWTNIRGEHIVNFLAKAPGKKAVFYKSICTSGISQNAENVAQAICEIIEELGATKFIGVVTDNAAVMRRAWRLIEETYPHINAYGCAAHCLNLLIKDLLEPHSVTISDSGKLIKFINNHHMACALYDGIRKEMNVGCSLSLPVATRWYSIYNSLKSVQDSEYAIRKLCDANSEDLKSIKQSEATSLIKMVASPAFWKKLCDVINLIEYPTKIIGEFRMTLIICEFYFSEKKLS